MKINAFKPIRKNKRIEYSDKIKAAVLDPNITIKELHINGGYDWIDTKYGFIKLLISRGQVLQIVTHSDLMARQDYLDAIKLGVLKARSIGVIFTHLDKASGASEKRLELARLRFAEFAEGNATSFVTSPDMLNTLKKVQAYLLPGLEAHDNNLAKLLQATIEKAEGKQ